MRRDDRVRAHVVGLGLVGSSIALGLRARGAEVSGEDVDASRQSRALDLGVVDTLGRGAGASLAFVATPAASVVTVARRLIEASADGEPPLVVTDVAGVKAAVAAGVGDDRFVPGHPMAGSEQEGPEGADPDLFVGAAWVLTPTSDTSEWAFTVVRDVVVSLGADVVVLPPERHDELVAVVSHVPHLTSAALMSVAGEAETEREALLRLAAGGFRDMTRVAAGSPQIWPDICRDNAEAIVPALDRLLERLGKVRQAVAGGDRGGLIEILEGARDARRNLPARGSRPPEATELRVVVPDRPGTLADVTSIAAALDVNIYDLEIAHSSEGPRGVILLAVADTAGEALATALRERGYRISSTSEGVRTPS
jgi:prephenate dehydrogenase